MMRTRKLLVPAAIAAISIGAVGCGGSPEVGDAVVVPPGQEAPAAKAEKPAETPADVVDPSVAPGDPPRTAPTDTPKAD
ncbi:hypothetical protein [Planctomyces sp. SH-PL62]|uniref:hypothetical protein n=1 Tax=Planctomyces sp. SH-PL62 TaxID=1636152 RepID=UPI00078EC0A7|nr:hypothetical protein [Planctomyces sp. SH-PL62]AMV37315.1 hypothetical protein VT85_07770 [Planctomyces sp. SH-PL62]